MNAARSRVLVVGAWFPYPPRSGWAMRVYQLARQLASRHDVTLLGYATAADEQNVAELESQGLRVETVRQETLSTAGRRKAQLRSLFSRTPYEPYRTYSRDMQRAIDRLCAETRYDVVQLESTLVWPFRFPAGTRIVLDEHNVDYETYARMREGTRSPVRKAFYLVEQARVRRYEHDAWRRSSGLVLTSAREQEMARDAAPGTPTAVVPNGVDTDFFQPGAGEVAPRTLVFNGVLDYRPNLDAALVLADDVLPRVQATHPDARAVIVGRGGPAELDLVRRPGVEATGEVPDVRPHLQQAEIVVVPILAGSGTRFKVVEGLAMAKPMVSTSVGCEGIGVEHEKHLLIADTPEEFAAAVTRLLDDHALARSLGEAGREFVEREYSWERAGERLQALYDVVLGAR
jgi:glycosyltransferase involved in cell wall biosynthesis